MVVGISLRIPLCYVTYWFDESISSQYFAIVSFYLTCSIRATPKLGQFLEQTGRYEGVLFFHDRSHLLWPNYMLSHIGSGSVSVKRFIPSGRCCCLRLEFSVGSSKGERYVKLILAKRV